MLPGRQQNESSYHLLLWVGVAFAIAVSASCSSARDAEEPAPIIDKLGDIPRNQTVMVSRAADYIGPGGCLECHQSRCEEFFETSHFRASRIPAIDEMAAKLAVSNEYRSANPKIRFRIDQDGEVFQQTSIVATSRVQRERSEEMAIVFGGGNVDEIYHYWSGNELYQLPIAYINPLKSWGNAPGYEDGTAVFERAVEPRCLECHATHFTHIPGSDNSYRTDNFILGVSCERCHGPGKQHREFHRANPDEQEAQHILHPGELPRERQIEVCTQCHGDASLRKTPPFSYIPGEPLANHFRFDQGTFPEDDHTANQVGVLRQSRCFIESPEMTCNTCHDPHVARADDMRAGSASCLSCHQAQSCGGHGTFPAEVRGRCVSCHMPRQNVMNIWFSTAGDDFIPLISRASHRIAINLVATDHVLLQWHTEQEGQQHRQAEQSLRQSLVSTSYSRAQELRAEYRFRAAAGTYREALTIKEDGQIRSEFEELIALMRALERDRVMASSLIQDRQYKAAAETLRGILKIKPTDAMAHGRLGMALASMGERDKGMKSLQQVAIHDPDLAYGDVLIGWLHYQDKQGDESVTAYERALQVRPYNAQLRYQYALALILLGRTADARRELTTALSIDPTHTLAQSKLRQLPREH